MSSQFWKVGKKTRRTEKCQKHPWVKTRHSSGESGACWLLYPSAFCSHIFLLYYCFLVITQLSSLLFFIWGLFLNLFSNLLSYICPTFCNTSFIFSRFWGSLFCNEFQLSYMAMCFIAPAMERFHFAFCYVQICLHCVSNT